jgi:hypothetical protein
MWATTTIHVAVACISLLNRCGGNPGHNVHSKSRIGDLAAAASTSYITLLSVLSYAGAADHHAFTSSLQAAAATAATLARRLQLFFDHTDKYCSAHHVNSIQRAGNIRASYGLPLCQPGHSEVESVFLCRATSMM